MTQASSHLSEILQTIRSFKTQNQLGLCVFDLDSTLFDVSPRIEKILVEFGEKPEYQQRFPEYIQYFKGIKTRRSDWGIKDALIRAGVTEAHPDLQKAVRDYWVQHFFSNEYLYYDVPYEGAVKYVQDLHRLGAHIAYLTGRDVHRMGKGSAEVLEKWKFPLNNTNAKLFLKPHRELEDAEFKTEWFDQSELQKYSKIWFFENEPVNINHLRAKNPKVEVLYFESTHSGRQQPPEDIPRLVHYILDGE